MKVTNAWELMTDNTVDRVFADRFLQQYDVTRALKWAEIDLVVQNVFVPLGGRETVTIRHAAERISTDAVY